MHEGGISIWFFIGGCLCIMSALILGSGVMELMNPPPLEHRVVLYELHAPVWWGGVMLALGVFYCVRFRPGRGGTVR